MNEEKEKTRAEETISGKAEEFRAMVRGIFPPEFRRHALAARKEILLAVRSLIDARVESLERAEKASEKKATKIRVE
jgi:hypothetical protein